MADECDKQKAVLLRSLSQDLPTLPGYLFELNELLMAPVVDLQCVSGVIGTDPSLSAQVLRLCNSFSLYTHHSVGSIEEAVVLLGRERLHHLVRTCSMVGDIGKPLGVTKVQSFWQHSFMNAVLSERLATLTHYPEPRHAYLAGLLHDLGALPLLVLSMGEEKTEPLSLEGIGESLETERKHFGLDHCEIGHRLGISWNFSLALVEVLEHHHQPDKAVYDRPLLAIVAAADRLCVLCSIVLGGTVSRLGSSVASEFDPVLQECLPGLSPAESARFAEILEADFLHCIPQLEFNSAGIAGGPNYPETRAGRE